MKKQLLVVAITIASVLVGHAQQDAQYTHYMYNTISVNPAYAGSRDALSVLALYRSQWVGLEGAPRNITFSAHTPLRNERLGLGVSLVRDELWIQDETYLDIDFSYTIETARGSLAFGLKAGAHILNLDLTRTNPEDPSDANLGAASNIDNRFSPNVGLGVYYYTDKFYIGYSAPSLLQTNYYDDKNLNGVSYLSKDRVNHYLMGGYVFDLNPQLKLKPAFLLKAISGAPLQVDVSANMLFNEKLTLGLAYRWDAALSGLAGFQLSEGVMIGYAYDWDTTDLRQVNRGSHEVFLRWEFGGNKRGFISPRFF